MIRSAGRTNRPPSREEGRNRAILAATLLAAVAHPLAAREVVDAAPASDVSVTIYRDPDRSEDERVRQEDPRGFAMISETRRVTLPSGESTIRFEGVAEGMIGVSAIVTGLPGGTIEKNRNAQILSPAALVDGTLGNRVTVTRTNPATGEARAEPAVVRTRADGGLVLETSESFEAVRCAGLPEKLTFDRVPAGLSAGPVFSVDTRSPEGGTYEVTLTYLSWGFDWQADYVARLNQPDPGRKGELQFSLLSWLTLVNDNGQGFDAARLQIVAGRLKVVSDYRGLADPPDAEPLRLTCYPIGSTADGTPVAYPPPPPPPPPMSAAPAPMMAEAITVTGGRRAAADAAVVTASEENLGDLKLFRVPGRVDVAAKGMKQVAFLNQGAVRARTLYQAACNPDLTFDEQGAEPAPASLLAVTRNEAARGLGMALPQGAMTLYEPTAGGERLAGRSTLRDYARGQEIELELGESAQVFARCAAIVEGDPRGWTVMRAELSNANPHPVTLRLQLGWAGQHDIRFPGQKVAVKNGWQTVVVTIPANAERRFDWSLRDRTDE